MRIVGELKGLRGWQPFVDGILIRKQVVEFRAAEYNTLTEWERVQHAKPFLMMVSFSRQ